jgi:hypothetical protein
MWTLRRPVWQGACHTFSEGLTLQISQSVHASVSPSGSLKPVASICTSPGLTI